MSEYNEEYFYKVSSPATIDIYIWGTKAMLITLFFMAVANSSMHLAA